MKFIPLERNQFTNLLLNQQRTKDVSNKNTKCNCQSCSIPNQQTNCDCSQINVGILLHPSSLTSAHDFSVESFLNQFSLNLLSKLPHGQSINVIGIAIVMPKKELNQEGENDFLREFWKFSPPQYHNNNYSKRILISLPGDGNSLWFHLSPFLSFNSNSFPSKL